METTIQNFEDIRPLTDEEVPATIEKLIANDYFRRAAEPLIQPLSWEQVSKAMRGCDTVLSFQKNIIYPLVVQLLERTTTNFEGKNFDIVKDKLNHVYVSNHRDIVLDAAILNILMFNKGLTSTEIAIGDNLLIYPWIKDLVRLNKNFIVKRNVPVRQMIEASHQLSKYIHYAINHKNQSVWIAQREGRAKNSDDRTQTSLVKMLALHNRANPLEAIINLDIVPLAITYEYDPCDYLKAEEFQRRRDNPDFKKSQKDDLINMQTGITGFKGKVYFQLGTPLNDLLDKKEKPTEKNDIIPFVARLIDKEIFKNYVFFPHNYVAYDMMMQTEDFTSEYSPDDKREFEEYVAKQVAKVDLKHKDDVFLHEKIVEMYANTLKNYLSVTQSPTTTPEQ